ncbi:MAG: hypothetical protein JNK53_03700, partial [Phycisphaerae bacterium]|nr:hypothetical protein [Phycisphaerae bacterium]
AGPDITTVTFDGFENFTVITDQYLDQGIVFTQPGFTAYEPGYSSGGWLVTHVGSHPPGVIYPEDGTRATFTTPMRSIALNHFAFSGSLQVTLFSGGEAFWTGAIGPNFSARGMENPWEFAGLVSDQPFDGVWLCAAPHTGFPGNLPSYSILIDTLSFSTVPTPGALIAMAPLAFGLTRRRSRGCCRRPR